MQTIIQRIDSGELTRDNDTKGECGFWDLARARVENEDVCKSVFSDYWEIYDLVSGNINIDDIPF